PNMKEVVRKEVLKLLDAEIIYPISDSKWVNVPFEWSPACQNAFDKLKDALISAPIIQSPDWSLPFELMCDASDYAVGAVLGLRKDKKPHVIYYAKFNIEIRDKKGVENVVADHLSRIPSQDLTQFDEPIHDNFPDEQLFKVNVIRASSVVPWYADIANYLTISLIPDHWSKQDRHKFFRKVRTFFWDEPYLFKYCPDQIIRRCIPDHEQQSVINFSHTLAFAVDYVSKWVEAIPARTNDHRTVVKFLKENIFSRFGMPRAIISDGGSHFCNKVVAGLMMKYGVLHKVATPYHPQTNGESAVTGDAYFEDSSTLVGVGFYLLTGELESEELFSLYTKNVHPDLIVPQVCVHEAEISLVVDERWVNARHVCGGPGKKPATRSRSSSRLAGGFQARESKKDPSLSPAMMACRETGRQNPSSQGTDMMNSKKWWLEVYKDADGGGVGVWVD
ncbi:uncharacterized protein LOC127802887, partial [Diospyros lotus]|uniref:uncharacterized protein LOC127802887 n=1 Tax=Diospyros lotus TaxID=55363 RepID=UPI00225BF4D5